MAAPEVAISVGLDYARLHFLSQITLPTGFPVTGKAGDRMASYGIRYAGGRVQEVPLRNGFEVAVANMVDEATRINPDTTVAMGGTKTTVLVTPAQAGVHFSAEDTRFPLARE